MPWKPLHEEDYPTLGWHVADQMSAYLAAPDRGEYEAFVPTLEQQEYLNELYRLDPSTGRRIRKRSVISRARGWGKSPVLAAIACAEALFEVVPTGWDAQGQPVAKPWLDIRTPLVLVTAVTEDQVAFTWQPLLEMLRNGPAVDEFDIDPMDSYVDLGRGAIERRTLSPRSSKGARAVCTLMDQTEQWTPSIGGPKFAHVLRSNAAKVDGITIESPNAYTIGERSVAEQSAKFFHDRQTGRVKVTEEAASLFYDHRQAPPGTDIGDMQSLVEALRYVYGDSSDHPEGCVLHEPPCPPGWAPIGRIANDFFDTSNEPEEMRADFLNQIESPRNSFMTEPEVQAATRKVIVPESEPVTLGFDGSEGRQRGVADSTVLVGFGLQSKTIFRLGLWEQPEGPRGVGWKPPKLEVNARVREVFATRNVVGFYADPSAGWAGDVKAWEAQFHQRLVAKVTGNEPIKWQQKNVTRSAETFELMYSGLRSGELFLDDDPALIRHFLNALRDPRRAGYVLAKPLDNPDFAKIDLAWGAMFALAAGMDAIGKGAARQRIKRKSVIRRIR